MLNPDPLPRNPVDPAAQFSTLLADVPLLMLPVRLETRFYHNPDRLRIRIFPDQIHVNSHQPALGETEAELGQHFWEIVWRTGADQASRIFGRLAQTLGVWRAAWVMEATTPTNLDTLGKDDPIFPPVQGSKTVTAPARLALLPERWFAIGYQQNEPVFVESGEPIPDALRFAPFQMHGTDDLDRWMVDFEAASRVGMALEIALVGSKERVARTGLDELIVVGARFDAPNRLAQALESTLQGHYYTRGFDFVPQGTPTNNTETVDSPWQWDSADSTAVFERIWQSTEAQAGSHRQRFAQALGIGADGVAARALHADAVEVPNMEAMNRALWYVTWGEYLRFVLGDGDNALLPDATIDQVRDWFVDHVRGGAVYPAFQIGSMPYGILPIQVQQHPAQAHTVDQYLQTALWNLRAGWERSLPNVPNLDPAATSSGTDTPTDLEAASENLIALLSSQPHPVRFYTRELNNLRTWPYWSLLFDPVNLYEALKTTLIQAVQAADSAWGSQVAGDLSTPFTALSAQQSYFQGVLAEADRRMADVQAQIDTMAPSGGIVPPWLAQQINALEDEIARYQTVHDDAQVVLNLLNAHAGRVSPVNDLQLPPVMDVLSAETPDPEHFYFVYAETDTGWGDLPLVQATDAEGGAAAAVYLDWLHDYAHGTVSGMGPDGLPDPPPLLFQLVKRAIDRANAWENGSLFDLDHFLTRVDLASRTVSPAQQITAIKPLLASVARIGDLLDGALKSRADDPVRVAIAGVPRSAFRNAAASLRGYQQVTQRQTPALDRAVGLFDQWASQPENTGQSPAGHGTDLVPVKPGSRAALLADAAHTLAALPADELELRLQESLGLAMHRLDAWITAYAEDQVTTLREKHPVGIQIGGYGWVENLRPDQAGAVPSQGYIHAPSMTHAATAAVLRSGYSAYGDGTSASPLSVNLRSDRVRIANWTMDGLRQGQRINDMLGYRFERALHDDDLDVWIDPVRDAVAQSGSTELTGTTGSAVVDGLVLLELWNEGKGSLKSLVVSPKNHTFDEIRPALAALVEVTDALADLTLAESVHALVQGDYERASAVQNASALGDVAPPPVRSIWTPNAGMTITHRVMLIPQDTGSAWDDQGLSVRSALEPGLEAWVSSVVGPPNRVMFAVKRGGDSQAETFSLADLPLSALDAVFLAPTGDTIEGSGLAALITLAYRQDTDSTITIEAAVTPGDNAISLAEFMLLAASIRQMLGGARSASASDFIPGAGDDGSGSQVAEFEGRASHLVDQLAAAVDTLKKAAENPSAANEAMLRLAYFDLPQAIPASPDLSSEQITSVLSIAQARLDEARSKLAAAQGDQSTATRQIRAAHEMIAAILGDGFPAMVRFVAPLQPDWIRGESQVGSSDPRAVTGWLLNRARVQPNLAAVRDVTTTAEILQDGLQLPLSVVQIPYVADEPWAGLARPNADGADRLSILLLTNGSTAKLTGDVGGLVLDQWLERIPSEDALTGLTFHFDAPTSRPPQALLLAVPPPNRGWDFDLVRDTVREAFALARLRAVAPETLDEYGHQIPAVYLTSNLDMTGTTHDG